jgi:hypothetical protein
VPNLRKSRFRQILLNTICYDHRHKITLVPAIIDIEAVYQSSLPRVQQEETHLIINMPRSSKLKTVTINPFTSSRSTMIIPLPPIVSLFTSC